MKTNQCQNQPSANTIRFVFGDQLNLEHSWFQQVDDSVVYLLAEMSPEVEYVTHHIQKIVSIFLAMKSFSSALEKSGHRVIYLNLDETLGQGFSEIVEFVTTQLGATRFEYQRPDEYRLLEITQALSLSNCKIVQFDTEHFLLPFTDIRKQFKPEKASRMEAFYRRMRKRYNLLMEGEQPQGGQWNFDQKNRSSFTAEARSLIPKPRTFQRNDEDILARLQRNQVNSLGQMSEQRLWPVTQEEAELLLDDFCEHGLPFFGTYQDAMTENVESGWLAFHSRLSFALNIKLLHPGAVIDAAIAAFHRREDIDIAQVEGFVRQILGWREYIRAMYWTNMPNYSQQNMLHAMKPLPSWYWDGNTQMNCLKQAITQSLEKAYAHHIQRLMVTGNFALLAGINPDDVDAWYLGIYIDAFEWVELPNTRGMALFADGGWLASKPYAASGQYISRMSDYCKQCRYNVKKKTGADACPLNSLYWDFLDRNKATLQNNNRLALAYRNWARYQPSEQEAILQQARIHLKNIDQL
jgi:deoxyribodipyrimidine photolyase-related protein